MIITANDLKVKGISLIEKVLKIEPEVLISVRGKRKYIVMPVKRYDKMREAELLESLRQAKEDYKSGNYTAMTVDEHMKDLGYAKIDYK